MEYFSSLKRNELSSYQKTWRNLTCILLNEANQKRFLTVTFAKGKTMETVERSLVGGAFGEERDEQMEHRGFL